jgi:hypothetical protein
LASAPAKVAWQGFTWGTLIFASLFLFYYFQADLVEHIHGTRLDSKSDTKERIYQGGSLNFGHVQVQGERQNPYNQIINRLRTSLDTIIASPWMSITFGAGIVLRIAGFTAGSIWYDEMFSLQVTRQGLVEMVQSLTLNISPPGFEILLWFVTRIFGWNVFSLRLISVLASILMLWAVYKITSVLRFSQRQKIVTLAAIGMLPYQLITAQQGRVYALFALLYLIALYASIRSKWVLLGISIAGMLWCHNISFLFIPGLLLISILECPKGFKQITSAATIAFVTFIPWAELSFRQAKMSIPWFAPLTPSTLAYNVLSLVGIFRPHSLFLLHCGLLRSVLSH